MLIVPLLRSESLGDNHNYFNKKNVIFMSGCTMKYYPEFFKTYFVYVSMNITDLIFPSVFLPRP